MIFENSLPKRYFWQNKMEYEISFLSWDSRYFWSGALNTLPSGRPTCGLLRTRGCFHSLGLDVEKIGNM